MAPDRVLWTGAHLQSVYSRSWKNTAVYGASQAQTTICSTLFAITTVTPLNIGDFLWKARIRQAGRGFSAGDAAKNVQIRAGPPPILMWEFILPA